MTIYFGLCVWGLLTMKVEVYSSSMETHKPTVHPMVSGRPFMVAWNAPTQDCRPRFNVTLDLRIFDINSSPRKDVVNQSLTLFYKERLGLYPYYDERNMSINGGVPQNASLQDHLEKMLAGINKYIPSAGKTGLGVIDWEEWRPIWIQNWESKEKYKRASWRLVASSYPNLTTKEAFKTARVKFETSARTFMQETLRHAKNVRPLHLWGYYLFPDCYNHDYLNSWDNYTGKCPEVEKARNDQLRWLLEESVALYPSIYLDSSLRTSVNGLRFVHHRVKEAMRLASQNLAYSLPVFVYARPTYKDNLNVISQMDLVNTIGESAAQGAAGVILWGDTNYSTSKETCRNLKSFVDEGLGRYIVNVTTAASLCSQMLCGGNGRCLRKANLTDAFLHLNPTSFHIVRAPPGSNKSVPMWAEGQLSSEDVARLRSQFDCQCYLNFAGNACSLQNRTFNNGSHPPLQPMRRKGALR